jgi:hypothetical protein
MHKIRRIYDMHLKDFMKSRYGILADNIKEHQQLTDNQVLNEMKKVSSENSSAGSAAKKILNRDHFKVLYQRKPSDMKYDPAHALKFENSGVFH